MKGKIGYQREEIFMAFWGSRQRFSGNLGATSFYGSF
jgi:hypothetical protein